MAGQTISTASGKLYLTSASNPLTITSTGSVTTTASGDAIDAPSGTAWQINNAGTISGVIGTSSAGIYSPASGIAVQNTGKISGYVAGLWLSSGGSVTNGASGLISATGSYGVYIAGAAGVVTNLGTITGSSYAVDLTFSSAANRVVVAPGAVFNGLVSGGNGTLELASGDGSGSITGLNTGSFKNFAALVVDAGASWTLSGSNTIASVTDDGSLVITGALPAATYQIGAAAGGGTLEVASAPSAASPISFLGNSKLIIDSAAGFGANIGNASYSGPLLEDFVSGDTIDIKSFSAANASYTYNSVTGLLQVVNGSQTASLDFQTSTLGSGTFSLTSDGGTGLDVTLSQATAPAAPTITSPASGSTDTTTAEPAIAGTGVSGDTVTVSIDGTQVGTAPVSNSAWSFTPTSPLSNASHTITATQAAAGGPSSTAATDTFTVAVPTAPAAPTITSPASGSTDTTTAEPAIAGTGVSGDTVTVSIDGTQVGTAPVSNSAWSFTPTSPLSNASHTVTATQAAAGGPSSTAATDTFTVAVPTAPAAPTITSPASGSTDTTTAEPAIAGTGVSGDTVTVSIDGTQVGTAPVSNSAWSFTPTSPLSNASHTVTATQAAAGGPSSTAATDTFTVAVPTAPAAPTITSPASGSTDTTTAEPAIAGTGVSGDTVTVSIDGTQVGTALVSNSAWSYTPTSPLSNASHTVTATQAAAGGPSSTAATDTFTVAVPTAPAAPTIASPASGSTDMTTAEPAIAGTGVSGDTVTVSIDGTQVGTAPVSNSAWSFTPTSPLSNASHTVTATQAAAGGPSSTAATDTFTVAVPTAPAAPTITSPASGSTDTTTAEPAIAGTGVSGDTVTVSIDGTQVGTAPVSNSAWSFTPTSPLSNASHTVTATQAAAGGPSSTAATDTFTVAVPTAPAAPTITSPASGSTDTTTAEPAIAGTGVSGDTVTVSIDGTQVGTAPVSNSAWSFTPTSPLSNASHTVTATQAAAGGPSSTAATDTFTVAVPTAPAAPTITSPASGSTDTTTAEPAIAGTGVSGDTVTVSIDGTQVGTAPVSNSAWSFTPTSPLSNASHTVTATQAAAGGPSSTAATDTFTVAVPTAPAAPTITSPASGSTDTTTAEPAIAGTGVSGDTVTVSIDGTQVGTAPVSNSAWSFTPTSPLSNASHTVTATQAAAGGPSSTAATDTFTVAVPTAPAAPTITSPASGSTDTTTAEPAIAGTGVSGDTVTVSIDGTQVGTALVSNSAWSYTPTSPLSNASHTVTATQAAAGGPSSTAATDTFTVAVPTAPAAPTIASPASGSTDTTTAEPAIAGTGVSGDTVTVSIDGTQVGTALVSNSAWSYTPTSPLSNASHTVTATQAAAGGPSSTAATDTFTVAVSSGGAGSSFVNTEFSGITDPNNYPPENTLAVDASNVVMAESSKIEWTNLSGGAAVNESLYTLFGSLPASETNSLIDVRVDYDSVNQRFVVMADNLGSNVSDIDIAVSKDSNPNDGWYVGSANSELTISGSATQADMPYLSVDGTNIYVSASQYGSTFAGTAEWVFSDSGIYTGGALNTVTSQLAPPGPGIVRNVSGGNGNTYYVSANPTGGQTVLTFQTYNSTSNSFNSTTTIALGDSDQGAGPNDYTVAQKGTSLLLNAYDSRVASLAYSNGFVYGVSEIEPSGSSVPEIEWFKINVSNPNAPTLAAQGQITSAAIGSGVGVFNPSLAVDAAGDVLVNFTASGASIYPTDYYAYEDAGGSSFSAAAPYQSSTSYFNSGASGAQRWGTYSTAIVDPNNPSSFWISNEYVASNWWQTVAAQVQLSPTGATPPAAPTITSPASGSTDTTTAEPAIAGTGVSGDTVTVSIDGTQVGTAPVSNSAWSFTPTSPLSNASHTVTATQAAAGGPSSTAATDTFTVNVSGGGRTISSAITGPLTLAATNNPLTITSAGSITTTASGDAVSGGSGTIWQIINTGTISGTIGSSSAGIYLQSAGSTVQNTGKIYGATAGIWLSDGGDVTNSAIGLITATGSYGVYIGGGPGVVTNAGTITGGWYAVDFATSSSANLLTVDPGAVFNGAVNGNGGVLELTAGSGSIGLIGSSAFSGFETLSDDGSALWTLTGANTIADVTDNGGLTIAGSLDVSAAVGAASTGQFDLQTGSSLEVAADTAAHSQVDFLGASQLTIDNAALFGTGVGGSSYAGPLLENFAAGDTIDLHGFMTAAAALLYNPANGLLQITNGASQLATVDFQNSTLGTGSFSFASDGNGGTLIKHS